ncbi:MAG: DUF6544 family protein [Candidatus Limnocylindria bacterium]
MTIPHDPGLPEPVARWREHALGIVRESAPSHVRLRLEGELSRKPGAGWTSWTATQEMAVDRLEFSWRARLTPVALVSVIAFDALAGSTGSGDARLWGFIPIGSSRGPEVTKTQLVRNLAELVFVPWAIDRNDQVAWQAVGPNSFTASAALGGVLGVVQFELDADGNVMSVSASDRPVPMGRRLVPAPWHMRFSGHEAVRGVRVPRTAEGSYDLPTGTWTYWRSHLMDLTPE